MESSIAFRIVRTAPLMQSLVHFFGDTLRRERALFLPLGEGRVRWVHGRDVAALIASAAARGEGPADRNGVGRGAAHGNTGPGVLQAIAGPEALRLDEVVEILGHALGTPLRFVDVPEEAAERALTEGGLSPWAVRSLVEIHGECREGLFCADTPEVDAALGRPRLRFVRYAEEVAPLLR